MTGGGLYTEHCENPYRSNTPPHAHLDPTLRKYGYDYAADLLANAHQGDA